MGISYKPNPALLRVGLFSFFLVSCSSPKSIPLSSTLAMQLNNKECLGSNEIKNGIQQLVNSYANKKYINNIALSISGGSEGSTFHYVSTNDSGQSATDEPFTEQSPYFMASATKLYATTLVMQLRHEGSLELDNKITNYFDQDELLGLHLLDGLDRTAEITIKHLLSHTSGLADYFDGKQANGKSVSSDLLTGIDQQYTVNDVIKLVAEELPAKFPPGSPGKAFYSDTNFQLLGAIIEKITQKTLAENIRQRITDPLELKNTYLFNGERNEEYARILPMMNKSKLVDIPLAMGSVRLDGGLVSNSSESLTFIQSFMQGNLFPISYLDELQKWNSIFFPLKAGVGLLKFELPWLMNPFGTRHSLVGHSGISGAFAFYSPTANLYLTGTINQLNNQRLPYNLMLGVIQATRKCRE